MQRGFVLIPIVVLSIFIALSGVFVYRYADLKKTALIKNFEECSKVYPVMESYPAQCNTSDGKHFVQELSEEEKKKLFSSSEDLEEVSSESAEENQVFCTGDEMVCPDGSNVGMKEPNCGFTKCPLE